MGLVDPLTWPEVANNALNVLQLVALTFIAYKTRNN